MGPAGLGAVPQPIGSTGNPVVLASCSRLNFCPSLQRHFCVFAVSFPGREALLTVYGTILAQHLALQKMPKVIQNLQPQLVAAALGESLPHRGVGRWHPHPPARGNPTTAQPVPWEPRAAPLHHGTVQTKPQLLLFSCSRLKCSVVSLEVVTLKPQACPSCRRSHWGERAGLRDPARGCGGLWGPACLLIPVPCQQPFTRGSPPPSCQRPSSSTTSSTSGTSPTYSR